MRNTDRFRLISVILFCLFTLLGNAQAVWKQYNGPFAGEIESFVRYGETLFVGSPLTGIFKSHDDGKTWNQTVHKLTYVQSLFDNDTSLLIGANGIFSYSDSTRDPVQIGQMIERPINDIHKMNGKLFISTDWMIYKYEPQLNQWVQKTNGIPEVENGVRWTRDMVSIGNILYCNSLATGLYKSVDEGETWDKVSILNFNDYGFNSVKARHDTLVCVADHHVFLSTNKGQSWSAVKSNLPEAGYFKMSFLGNQLFLSTTAGVFTLQEGATNWVKVDNASRYYIMQDEGIMFISGSSELNQWDSVSSKFIPSNKGINTSRVSDVELFNHKLYSGTHAGLHVTVPGSDDWQVVPELSNHFVTTVIKNKSKLFVGTNTGLYAANTSSNPTFIKVGGIPSTFVLDIDVLNDSIFLATANGIYISYNAGSSWQSIPNPPSEYTEVMFVSVSNNMLFAGDLGGLFRFNLESDNWEKIEFFNDIFSLNVIDKIIYAGQMNSNIFRSLDYGETWEYSNIPGSNKLDMVKRGNNIYAATYNKIYYSPDNGLSWNSFYETGIPSVMINCITQGENAFYVGTYGKSIWYRPYFVETNIESPVYLIQNDTIYDLEPSTTLPQLRENVSVSYGASIELEIITEADNALGDFNYVGVNRVKITAEDGITNRILNVDGAPGSAFVPRDPIDEDDADSDEDDADPEEEVVTGDEGANQFRIEVYPVPAQDKLSIKNFEMINSWQIINGIGQKILQQEQAYSSIDVSSFPKGIYYLIVNDHKGKSHRIKFLKA